MKKRFMLAAALLSILCLPTGAQDLKSFKLNNGMSVYVWEDHSSPEVFGAVAVKAGSFDDPSEYTGLAHYLEHVMFKGTQKIGSLYWDQEKPLYEQIVAKYDERAQASDKEVRESLNKEINDLSIRESRFSVANEYANLIESIGGSGLNAATSYDVTFYHNSFPSNQIVKWLQLASERFISPVFRGFQSELETVYEEYNMYRDNPSAQDRAFLFSKIFEGSPYGREVIGLGEHLKNPRLSKLIEFYDTWYAANNMALILVGDVDAKAILRFLNMTFGKLPRHDVPERPQYKNFEVSGRQEYSSKHSRYPSVFLAYNGVKAGDPDEIALELCARMLSNPNNTGLLDKLVVSGDLLAGAATPLTLKSQGRVLIQCIPFFDESQRTFSSSRKAISIVNKTVDRLSAGDFPDWLVETEKIAMCRDFDLQMETNEEKGSFLVNVFADGRDLNSELQYKERVMAVTVDDVKRIAKSYFNGNCIVVFNDQGDPLKSDKIAKPEIKPIEPAKGKSSQYANWFKSLPAPELKENYLDWSKVKEKGINSYSKLYYTENTHNEVYTLVLKYGANRKDLPKLQYGAELMDNAGVMNTFKSAETKEQFSRLGTTYSISADDNYLYVTLRGFEETLQPACQLLTKLMLIPDLDQKQLDNVKGGALSSRYVRKKDVNTLASALREYLLYGEESSYRCELSDQELSDLDISTLTGNVINATKYAAEIHYSGRLPFDRVYEILSTSLPLVEGERPSTSPLNRKLKQYGENTVLFLPNTQAQQAQIYFYIPMGDYDRQNDVISDAFSRYIGGGFNGIIMQEIREYNSMAYTATGSVSTNAACTSEGFIGYVGTQNDKALEAIELYNKIIRELPQHPENVDGIKTFLLQEALASQPDDRSLSSYIVRMRRAGYTEDPAIAHVPEIKALTFEAIMDYYNRNIKDKPLVIGVVGNPKLISVESLSKYGKVVKLRNNQLFNEKDMLF